MQRLSTRFSTKRYDIIHYSGHGNKNAELVLEDNTNRQKPYFASLKEIVELFSKSLPSLVYLDSCEGARGSDFTPSLATILNQKLKNSAIIANTASISDKMATKSVELFYSNLDKPFSQALFSIREGLNEEWYKSIGIALPNLRLFDPSLIESNRANIVRSFSFNKNNYYIYRYRLV